MQEQSRHENIIKQHPTGENTFNEKIMSKYLQMTRSYLSIHLKLKLMINVFTKTDQIDYKKISLEISPDDPVEQSQGICFDPSGN